MQKKKDAIEIDNIKDIFKEQQFQNSKEGDEGSDGDLVIIGPSMREHIDTKQQQKEIKKDELPI